MVQSINLTIVIVSTNRNKPVFVLNNECPANLDKSERKRPKFHEHDPYINENLHDQYHGQ